MKFHETLSNGNRVVACRRKNRWDKAKRAVVPEYGYDVERIFTSGHYFYYDSTMSRNIL